MFSRLIKELYKRKIGPTLIVYLGSAGVLIEAFSYFINRFNWPESIKDVVFVILVFGLPASIIQAWFHGKEGSQKVSKTEIGLHILNIVIFSYFIFQALTFYENVPDNIRKNALVDNNDKSIAVLPFINLSNDPDQEYFSDGMMEEVLNQLIKIKNLKVTSRTSSMQYKISDKSLREIGNELGVRYLLGGSVRKYEDKVRISTQLIEVETDVNIWSQSYDNKLVEIFDVQSEIAKNVASELSMVLSPTEIEQIDKKGTDSIEAYNLYLKGRHFFYRRTKGSEEIIKCIEYLEKSIAIDQFYAMAYAGLADAYITLSWRQWNTDPILGLETIEKAKANVKKALEIDPKLAEAHAALGYITYFVDWQWEEGRKILEQAIKLSPNYSVARQFYSAYFDVMRENGAARVQINKALELNPLSTMHLMSSESSYYQVNRLDEALNEVLKAKDLNSNNPGVYWVMFHIYKEQGKEGKAMQQLKHLWAMDSSKVEHIEFLDDVYAKNGMNAVVNWWMGFEEKKNPNSPHYIAMNYASIGENELALKWLERAFELGGPDLPTMNNNRMFENIRSDPRFISMLERMGLDGVKK